MTMSPCARCDRPSAASLGDAELVGVCRRILFSDRALGQGVDALAMAHYDCELAAMTAEAAGYVATKPFVDELRRWSVARHGNARACDSRLAALDSVASFRDQEASDRRFDPREAPRTVTDQHPTTIAVVVDPARAAFVVAARDVIAAKASPATRYAYSHDLNGWLAFCQLCEVDPAHATLADATRYRDALTGGAGTVRRRLATLSSIYRTLRRAGVTAGNPFHPEALSWPAPRRVLKAHRITDAQAQAILGAATENARDHALLRLLYDTGWRRTVIAELPRAQYCDGRVFSRGKGGKEVEAELPDVTIQALDRWLAEARTSSYVFPAEGPNAGDGHLHKNTVGEIVARYAATIAPDAHPHSFRALFIRAGFDAGLPSYEVQGAAGHSSADMTARYDGKARGAGVARQVAAFRERKR